MNMMNKNVRYRSDTRIVFTRLVDSPTTIIITMHQFISSNQLILITCLVETVYIMRITLWCRDTLVIELIYIALLDKQQLVG